MKFGQFTSFKLLLLVIASSAVVLATGSRLGMKISQEDRLWKLANQRIEKGTNHNKNDVVVAAAADPNHNRRQLQTSTKTQYQANYVARIKFLLDLACSASKPTVKIQCGPGGTLEILQFSHDSLQTLEQTSSNEATVGSTCGDRADCERVFVTNENDEDKFGEVYFQCTGDHERAAEAEIQTLPSSGPVECASGWTTRAFYMLELGVFCNDPEAVSDGFYSYAPQYFECTEGDALDEEFSNNHYSCFTGRNCNGLSCTEEQIDPAAIHANVDGFREFCLQSESVPGVAEPAPPTPTPFTPPEGDYTIRYQALWAFQYDSFWCGGSLPSAQLKCLGGGTLTLIENPNESEGTECEMVDGSTMVCQETCSSCSYWQWENTNGIIYECSGSDMQAARSEATYLSDTAYCESGSAYSTTPGIAHRVQLGLYCGTPVLGGEFKYSDAFTECANGAWHNVENGEGAYFQCLAYLEVELPGGRNDVTFSDVTIFTENITERVYEAMRDDNCFTADFAPAAPTTPAPTKAPEPSTTTQSGAVGGPSPTPEPTFASEEYCISTCGCTAPV